MIAVILLLAALVVGTMTYQAMQRHAAVVENWERTIADLHITQRYLRELETAVRTGRWGSVGFTLHLANRGDVEDALDELRISARTAETGLQSREGPDA